MQLGMIGLGRMGSNLVRRVQRAGHDCVVYDVVPTAVRALAADGATPTTSPADFAGRLDAPRAIWIMVPAAAVDSTLEGLTPLLEPGDIVIDGGNSHFEDDLRRAAILATTGIDYVDVGVSGGVHGLERGYCLMIGGADGAVARLDPVFAALAPGLDAAPRTAERVGDPSTAERGYLHCGPVGAGHFVKMVHNAIEYGLMAAYAEGLNLLSQAGQGRIARSADAETAPLPRPERYAYDFDLADVSELWRRGSVIGSWLLDLTAHALVRSDDLAGFEGRVADSGEGRWAASAAIDLGVPTPVLTAALADRFTSRGEADFAHRVLSALRREFGGHGEAGGSAGANPGGGSASGALRGGDE